MKVYRWRDLPDDLPVGAEVVVISKDGKYRELVKVGEFRGKCKGKVNPRRSVWYGKEEEKLDKKKHGHAIRDFRKVVERIVGLDKLEWERDPKKKKGFMVFAPSKEVREFLAPHLRDRNAWVKLTLGGLDDEDNYIYVIHVSYRRKRSKR